MADEYGILTGRSMSVLERFNKPRQLSALYTVNQSNFRHTDDCWYWTDPADSE